MLGRELPPTNASSSELNHNLIFNPIQSANSVCLEFEPLESHWWSPRFDIKTSCKTLSTGP